MAPYQFIILCLFAFWAVWYLGQKIEYAGAERAIASKEPGPSVADAERVAQIAAVLIGAAMNNPQYVARMAELRSTRNQDRASKPTGIKEIFQSKEDQERVAQEIKWLDEDIRDLDRAIAETDLFGNGSQPYIDLAFHIYRSVYKLQRQGNTFAELDSERAINSKDSERAHDIFRSQLLRDLARS